MYDRGLAVEIGSLMGILGAVADDPQDSVSGGRDLGLLIRANPAVLAVTDKCLLDQFARLPKRTD